MKYSIFQYSQEKLLENGLDVIDALILSWFADFFVTGMEKRLFQNDEKKPSGKLFGWVKLSKVLEDIPCIGINSEKGIKRRFNNFVEKGIMERRSILTQNGKKTYYRPTEQYDALINSKSQEKENQNNSEQTDQNEVKNPQGYSDSHAENKNPHGTKTTDAESKNAQKIPHGYFDSHAQGYFDSHAQGYSDSHALNNSSTSNYSITDAALNISEIKNISENIFGKNAFDSAFSKKAAVFFDSKKLKNSDIKNYFEYIKLKTDSKNAQNPRGLAYSLIFQNDILQEFLDKQTEIENQEKAAKEKEQELEKQKITCPCCHNRFHPYLKNECPECHLLTVDFADNEKVKKHERLINLPQKLQEKYFLEVLNFRNDLPFLERVQYQNTELGAKERQEFMLALEKKYNLIE